MIKVINVSKSFGDKKVLENFNAEFDSGVNCLMGDSGSGKTVLVRLTLGLLKPDSGEIRGTEGKKINCVFQENRLIDELSAVKNLMLVCDKTKKEEISNLLCKLGLEGNVHYPVYTLSGGMKRRVAIARALINPADIYIFDEPFKGLDDYRKDSVAEIIKEYTKGAVTIVVTHDTKDVELLGARKVKIKSTRN